LPKNPAIGGIPANDNNPKTNKKLKQKFAWFKELNQLNF
jgi:hypothetical protein